MRGGRHSRFTVFDMLESKGFFDQNPANSTSPQYTGPQEFPKAFYHPQGKMRVIQKAEIIQTPMGPEKVGEQWELISRTVENAEEEARARAAGWWDHPAKAIEASGEKAPPTASRSELAELERQMAVIQARIMAAKNAAPPPPDDFAIEGLPPLPEESKLAPSRRNNRAEPNG